MGDIQNAPNIQMFKFFSNLRTCTSFLDSFIHYWEVHYPVNFPSFPIELILLLVPLTIWMATLIFVTIIHFFTQHFFPKRKEHWLAHKILWKESFNELKRFFTETDSFVIVFFFVTIFESFIWCFHPFLPKLWFSRLRKFEFIYNMAFIVEVFLSCCINLSPILPYFGIRPRTITWILAPLVGMPGYEELEGNLGKSLLSAIFG